jgi:DNA-binding MarR family transcriptional regulator
MDRQQLVAEIFENLSAMRRKMFGQWSQANQAKDGPTYAQMGVLSMIFHHEHVLVKDIADKFGITGSAATQIVNSLVKRGWVERHKGERDKRQVALKLSTAGKRVHDKLMAERVTLFTQTLDVLTDTELKQLHAIQKKLLHSPRS